MTFCPLPCSKIAHTPPNPVFHPTSMHHRDIIRVRTRPHTACTASQVLHSSKGSNEAPKPFTSMHHQAHKRLRTRLTTAAQLAFLNCCVDLLLDTLLNGEAQLQTPGSRIYSAELCVDNQWESLTRCR